MGETQILSEIKKLDEKIEKIKREVTEIRETLVALKMGVIGFDNIDNQLRDIKRKLDNLR